MAQVAELLLESGADVNAQRVFALETPLHFAAMNGHVACVRLLVAAGASTEARNRNGERPLELAKEYRRLEVLRLLGRPPDAPAAPAVARVTADSLFVTWTPPADYDVAVISYDVRLVSAPYSGRPGTALAAGSDVVLPQVPGNVAHVDIGDLLPARDFRVCVRASNVVGVSDWSPFTDIATLGV